jgi:hypothetical protein
MFVCFGYPFLLLACFIAWVFFSFLLTTLHFSLQSFVDDTLLYCLLFVQLFSSPHVIASAYLSSFILSLMLVIGLLFVCTRVSL